MNSLPKSPYYAHIDGLRAIAVLLVIFYHAGLGASGGYVGVDVFFVISGYLISRLILQEMSNHRFSMLEFWERRLRRLFPAVAVMVALTLVIGRTLDMPSAELAHSALAQFALASNVYFWRNSGYFDPPAELKPLLHTWSLAVEEQFYLIFPFLLLALTRLSSNRKVLAGALLLLFGISFGFSVYGTHRFPMFSFYMLPSRAWELLLGALVYVCSRSISADKPSHEFLSVFGLLMIFAAVYFYDGRTRFPGAAALLPCVGTAFVIWANDQEPTCGGRILAIRPLVLVGQASYSLYLWHWPLIVFLKFHMIEPLTPAMKIGLLLSTLAMGFLSWRLVESPFRSRTVVPTRHGIFAFAGIVTAVLCVGACFTLLYPEFSSDEWSTEAKQYAAGEADRGFLIELTLQQAVAGDFIELGHGDRSLPISLFVNGDSHAMAILPLIDVLCKEKGIRGVAATHSSTMPFVNFVDGSGLGPDCVPFQDAIVKFVRANRVGHVIHVACWDNFTSRGKVGQDQLRQGLAETIAAYRGSGTKLWIMKQVPKQEWEVPRMLVDAVHSRRTRRDVETLGLPLSEHLKNQALEAPALDHVPAPNVVVLDPTVYFLNPYDKCRVARGGKALYCDIHHLTVAGAMELRPLFEPLFQELNK